MSSDVGRRSNRTVRCTEHDHVLIVHGDGAGQTTYQVDCPPVCPGHVVDPVDPFSTS
jgi:hypothetical protein